MASDRTAHEKCCHLRRPHKSDRYIVKQMHVYTYCPMSWLDHSTALSSARFIARYLSVMVVRSSVCYATADSPEPTFLQIFVMTPKTVTLDVDALETFDSVKVKIQDKTGIPPSLQRLVAGRSQMTAPWRMLVCARSRSSACERHPYAAQAGTRRRSLQRQAAARARRPRRPFALTLRSSTTRLCSSEDGPATAWCIGWSRSMSPPSLGRDRGQRSTQRSQD